MTHIVIRAPNWLGDVVMSLPFIHELAALYPSAQLHVIIKADYAPLLRLLPSHISCRPWHYNRRTQSSFFKLRVFCRQIRRELGPIDQYYALPPSFSAGLMGWFLGARERVGYKSQARSLVLTRSLPWPESGHRSDEYWGLLSYDPRRGSKAPTWIAPPVEEEVAPPFPSYYVLNPNSQASSRRLPLKSWVDLLKHFQGQRFVLIGGPGEFDRVEALREMLAREAGGNEYANMAGKTSIIGLVALLQKSQGLITNDSGPAHLAHCAGVPTAVFFGAGNADNTGPFYGSGRSMVIKEPMSCSPCLKNTCPLGTLACLTSLNMEFWGEEIRKFLKADASMQPKPLAAKGLFL